MVLLSAMKALLSALLWLLTPLFQMMALSAVICCAGLALVLAGWIYRSAIWGLCRRAGGQRSGAQSRFVDPPPD